MNFHQLLQQRDALLQQARLANLAYAYARLGDFAGRIARGQLQGLVRLSTSDSATDRTWPGLTALEGSQAALEEHFLDEDIIELADILGFLGQEIDADGLTFRLEELDARYRLGLRRELEAAHLLPAREAPSPEDSGRPRG